MVPRARPRSTFTVVEPAPDAACRKVGLKQFKPRSQGVQMVGEVDFVVSH